MDWTRAALAVAIGAAITGGCGGDGEDDRAATPAPETGTATPTPTATSTPGLTHDEFVAQVDAVCRAGNRVVTRYNRQFQAAADAGDLDRAADIREAAYEANRDRFDDFPDAAPPEDQAAYERYLRQVRRIQALEPRIVAALRDGNIAEVQRLNELGEDFRNQRTAVALDLGFEVCGG